jgi:crotonobetainyl-CoA:carnitine CoA-transferase CaiB-like acyl-CoA transferase
MNGTSKGPLSGLRVLEFGQIAAGPYVGMLLADLGADVVKVERPDGGDGMRDWPPLMAPEEPEHASRFSGNFASLNRNKRSITVDLKAPDEVAHLQELCRAADVIIENFRPGVLKRLGLGYEAVAKVNPRIVYCSISGYGQVGPYAKKGAFDVTVQAISGLMSVTGEPDGSPVKCGVPVGDFCAGLYAAYCISAVLRKVAETGKGAFIDCSMLGSLLGISALQTSEYFGTGVVPRRLGSAHPRNAPYQGFDAEDAPFVVAAGNQELWRKFCGVVGREEFTADPRFETQELRARHQAELFDLVQPIFSTKPRTHWLTELDAQGIPCAPVNSFDSILADPHVEAMGLLHNLTLPNGVRTTTVGFPIAISDFEFKVDRPPPILGEHTKEVARDWIKESD